MKMLRHWKIISGLLVVFVAGIVCGSVATQETGRKAQSQSKSVDFTNWGGDVMHALHSKLNLTPEQHEKIKGIVDETCSEFKNAFGKALDGMGHTIVRSQHRIDQELTPEQRAIHTEMKKAFRQRLKDKLNLTLPEE